MNSSNRNPKHFASRCAHVLRFFCSTRQLRRLTLNPIFLFACLVKKDKDLWVFSSWNGKKYLDNPKYVYKYILENHPEMKPVWITKDKELYKELVRQQLPVEYAYSPRGLWRQLRASAAIYTHSVAWDFVPTVIGYTTKRVQTWHGVPIKKIGHDDKKAGNTRFREKIYAALIPYLSQRCDLVIACSKEDQEKYRSAFSVRPERVIITGYPRNDALLRSANSAGDDVQRRVVYMPTFRGGVNTEFTLLQDLSFDFKKFNQQLKEIKTELYIKLHPVQHFSAVDLAEIERASNIFSIGNDGDIYENIGGFGILITDYSGIYFDYLITNRPIIMAPFDLDSYIRNDRDLYYPYDDICPDAPCNNWNKVMGKITQYVCCDEKQGQRYADLIARFHKYSDDMSSRRVFDAIRRMVHNEDSQEKARIKPL